MVHKATLIVLLVCGLFTLGCSSADDEGMDGGMGGEMGTGGSGGDAGSAGAGGEAGSGGVGGSGGEACGADTECNPEAPSECGTLCQDICGGDDNFDSAGCGDDNRCFCVCLPAAGVCTGP